MVFLILHLEYERDYIRGNASLCVKHLLHYKRILKCCNAVLSETFIDKGTTILQKHTNLQGYKLVVNEIAKYYLFEYAEIRTYIVCKYIE